MYGNVLKQAQRIVDERRAQATERYNRTMELLRSYDDWNDAEYTLKKAQIAYAMGKTTQEELHTLKQNLVNVASKHGITEAQLVPSYTCKLCNDTGYVQGERCKCLKAQLRKLLFEQSNVVNKSATFANSTESNKHNKLAYKYVQGICDGTNGQLNVLLTGKTGTGKTYLMCCACNQLINSDYSVLMVTAYALNQQFLAYHTAPMEEKQRILEDVTQVDVLVIDDLGTETKLRNVTEEYLFLLLNERINNGKRTFISTNLTLEQLRDRYDERFFSRLVDKKLSFVYNLESKDKRIQ